jgi:hypothetical protein
MQCLSFHVRLSWGPMFSLFIHVVLFIWIWFLFKAEYYSFVNKCHILFICSSVDRNLGSFHLLLIVNDVAMNDGIKFECLLSIILGIQLELEWLTYIVILGLTFWAVIILSSTATKPFYTPTSNTWEIPFVHIAANNCYFFFK